MHGCNACTNAELALAAQLALDDGNDELAEELYAEAAGDAYSRGEVVESLNGLGAYKQQKKWKRSASRVEHYWGFHSDPSRLSPAQIQAGLGGLGAWGLCWPPWDCPEGDFELDDSGTIGEAADISTIDIDGSSFDINKVANTIGTTANALTTLIRQAQAGAVQAQMQLDQLMAQFRTQNQPQQRPVPGWVWAAGAGAAALVLVLAFRR